MVIYNILEIIKLKKKIVSFLLLSFYFTSNSYGQRLHHQMISSQGNSLKIANGMVILQSIGQQSTVGNFKKDYIVQQGFQQSLWGKYLTSNHSIKITATTYPNPFFSMVNFTFSQQIKDLIQIDIFDLNGKLVYKDSKNTTNELITIDLAHLAFGNYLVRLTSTNFIYYNQIIKQ